MSDPRDVALMAACPVIAAPRFGALPAMARGQRLVMAANGLFVQIRLPWMACLQRCGSVDPGLALPYGLLGPSLTFPFGAIPTPLLRGFLAQARRAAPIETAAVIVHCERSNALRLAACGTVEADADHIVYRHPPLAATEQIAVDLHSHGDEPAFFSAQDDADDQAIRICGVFGLVRERQPEVRFRLAINGMFIDLRDRWQAYFGEQN